MDSRRAGVHPKRKLGSRGRRGPPGQGKDLSVKGWKSSSGLSWQGGAGSGWGVGRGARTDSAFLGGSQCEEGCYSEGRRAPGLLGVWPRPGEHLEAPAQSPGPQLRMRNWCCVRMFRPRVRRVYLVTATDTLSPHSRTWSHGAQGQVPAAHPSSVTHHSQRTGQATKRFSRLYGKFCPGLKPGRGSSHRLAGLRAQTWSQKGLEWPLVAQSPTCPTRHPLHPDSSTWMLYKANTARESPLASCSFSPVVAVRPH